jgi:hypothetical protein
LLEGITTTFRIENRKSYTWSYLAIKSVAADGETPSPIPTYHINTVKKKKKKKFINKIKYYKEHYH